MAKGSQLSQLKAALSQAGVHEFSRKNKKKKTSSHTTERDKITKAAKLREIQQKLNPFDVKVTKLKHDVGGRKIKGVMGRPAQSKQAGIQQREKTLLKELEERGRVGGVVDRRFGEDDPSMSLEERMLERFTRERQRTSKADIFNLEDEEELTHYGQSLSKVDDFDDFGIPMDDDDDEGQLNHETVHKAHFGGFDEDHVAEKLDEPTSKKSKREVMAEVIAKSKEHKLRRQMEKEKEENIRYQLDQDFDSLKSLLYVSGPSPPEDAFDGAAETSIPDVKNDSLDYDKQVRELAFDKRAKPKDRTKTEEELALEKKEALEKAERRRQRRMLGEDPDESNDDMADGRKRKRAPVGDDLEDDFVGDDSGVVGAGLGEGNLVPGEVEDGEADSDGTADTGDDDSEEDGDNYSASGESTNRELGSEQGDFTEVMTAQQAPFPKISSRAPKELPYTFPAPASHEEFLEIVEDVRDEDVPVVIERMRAIYHPSFAPDNKLRLQTLTRILVDHILYVTSPPKPRIRLVSSLIPHLFALSRSYPSEAAEYFVGKLSLMYKNLSRGLASAVLEANSRTWPGFSELTFLRVTGIIWPTSDMKHVVVSPARLLMGAYLSLCRVRSFADLASGLFLSSLFLQYEARSKRFVPEAVNFVVNAVRFLAPNPYSSSDALPGSFPSPDLHSDLRAALTVNPKVARNLVFRKPDLWQLLSCDVTEQSKLDALGLAVDLLDRFAELYKPLDGFIELYDPIYSIISSLECERLSKDVQFSLMSVRDKVGRLLKFARQSRRPLLLQAHKPIPIPTYIPKFEQKSSSYLRRQDPDHERNEVSKLRYQLKQEKKGAIRELRKDARFIAAVEQKKQVEKDQAYSERMKKVFGSLEGERAEQKAMQRQKMRDKRRAGRK
ncbi:Nop14-like protein [Pisolithus thermaeus]|nr:Nop14-like protein [Pisolithus croceorrhizus]KAI6163212.1 Nop14-like protein [Pisolithus thermaeus]